MPVIPAMPALSGPVDPTDWYADGLFLPAQPPDTLEVLNGGCDAAQYTGGDDSIPIGVVDYGAFAVGRYDGFRDWQYAYARGANNDDDGSGRGRREVNRQVIGKLTATFVLPWAASFVWLSWEAFCRHDATQWDTDGDDPVVSRRYRKEFWDFRTYYDGSELVAIYARLPHGRYSVGDSNQAAPTDPDGYLDPGLHAENRWRHVTRCQMLTSAANCARGRHRVRVTGFPGIFTDDPKLAKLLIPSGRVTVLAVR